ncbi:Glrx [Symbiodinium sp. KB8]|nr:Glrx [Symbiodinium sp. KB8]
MLPPRQVDQQWRKRQEVIFTENTAWLLQLFEPAGAAEIAERDQDHVPEVKVLTTLGMFAVPVTAETTIGEIRQKVQEWKPEYSLEQIELVCKDKDELASGLGPVVQQDLAPQVTIGASRAGILQALVVYFELYCEQNAAEARPRSLGRFRGQTLLLVLGLYVVSRRLATSAPVLGVGVGLANPELQELENRITQSKVFVVSKQWCPFCQRLKSVLGDIGVAAEVLELEDMNKKPLVKDEAAVLDYMQQRTGARSVPRLFIAGKFVGGCDDAVTMASSGELQKRLKEVDRQLCRAERASPDQHILFSPCRWLNAMAGSALLRSSAIGGLVLAALQLPWCPRLSVSKQLLAGCLLGYLASVLDGSEKRPGCRRSPWLLRVVQRFWNQVLPRLFNIDCSLEDEEGLRKCGHCVVAALASAAVTSSSPSSPSSSPPLQ